VIDELSAAMAQTSICGLGQIAPAPVQSVIRHFRDEIDAHVRDRRCPDGVCPMS
jgi:NADH:ubiquinone oxidoreductase subunit F (NADH-binding)